MGENGEKKKNYLTVFSVIVALIVGGLVGYLYGLSRVKSTDLSVISQAISDYINETEAKKINQDCGSVSGGTIITVSKAGPKVIWDSTKGRIVGLCQ